MKKTSWAAIALVSVAVSWGAAFVLMKDAIADQPFYDFLAIRFLIAGLLMLAFRPKALRSFDKTTVKHGIFLGAILAGGYFTQTIGLELSTAAITGFITGLYVVLVPIFSWVLYKVKAGKRLVWGVILATIALGLISINGLAIGLGETWVILCAALFAAHIVGLSKLSPGKDVYALTVLQLLTVAVFSGIGAFITDGYQAPVDGFGWFAVLFTAVFATAIAFLVQTWAQSIMDASRVAILLTGEVAWTAIIAVMVGQEELSLKTIVGGLLMIASMLVVEWPTKNKNQPPVLLDPLVH
jgi:drug/metabolite transporter (DMT)-like permease